MLKVVDAVRYGFALFRVWKVMHIDLKRLAFASPRLARILQVSKRLLLLRINGNGWLTCAQLRSHAAIDSSELRIPIGVIGPFPCFTIGLEAVALIPQQPSYSARAHRVPLRRQDLSEDPRTLASPSQRRHWIAAAVGLDDSVQRGDQFRIDFVRSLTPCACAVLPSIRPVVG